MKLVKIIIVFLFFTIIPYFIGMLAISSEDFILQYLVGLYIEALVLFFIVGFLFTLSYFNTI